MAVFIWFVEMETSPMSFNYLLFIDVWDEPRPQIIIFVWSRLVSNPRQAPHPAENPTKGSLYGDCHHFLFITHYCCTQRQKVWSSFSGPTSQQPAWGSSSRRPGRATGGSVKNIDRWLRVTCMSIGQRSPIAGLQSLEPWRGSGD
jgi:hypothetical protein